MEDLLQSQIRESCKLALPSGLQELMADISREVIRAQPSDLYQFIAEYLSALLVARENLSVAARVCDNICNAQCWPELEDELRKIGLSEEDIVKTVEVVSGFLAGGRVEEASLLLRLLKKTEIGEGQYPAVLAAVRRAFLAHQLNTDWPCDSFSGSELDETANAVKHTLRLYEHRLTGLSEDYSNAAVTIQRAYRAYRVRRQMARGLEESNKNHADTEKSIRFKTQAQQQYPASSTAPLHRCASQVSSMSLAGSIITLPPFVPYSNNYSDIVEHEAFGDSEIERINIDYIGNNRIDAEQVEKHNDRKRSVSFHEDDEIYSNSVDAEDENNYIHGEETNHDACDDDVKTNIDRKNSERKHAEEEICEEVINNDIKVEENIHKAVTNPETIDGDAEIDEEINYDASDKEGDVEVEILNEKSSFH